MMTLAQSRDVGSLHALTWKQGDTLTLRGHTSEPGKGLSYPDSRVTAAESGVSGGWDVYDTADGASFYGYSVNAVQA